jgi:thiamine-monophosphate kinase
MQREDALIDWIRKQASPTCREMIVGIGDDCAIFRPRANQDLVFKIDPVIEGVHFAADMPGGDAGARALGRALSDIAAMGAEPRFCLVSLTLGPVHDEAWLKSFFRGLLKLARATNTMLAGGDLSRSALQTHVDVTLCGVVPKGTALRRDTAQVGDDIYVSGPLGRPWNHPVEPRLALGQALRGIATACMDLSDGLSRDLPRLCTASKVSAAIEHVPIYKGATIERALHGGEDYELLFTVPHGAKVPKGTTRIGSITAGRVGKVFYCGRPLPPLGWDHFSS